MSVTTNAIKHAVSVGYYIDEDGNVFYKGRQRKSDLSRTGYARFRIRDSRGKCVNVPVHRLQAYHKFGDSVFRDDIGVRHLDGNKVNNKRDNISIGTQSENMMDRTKEERVAHGRYANSFLIKHDAAKIKKDHELGMSYSGLMKKYGISSKGTISHIINKR